MIGRNMGRSSRWNIWDFHLHTPCSVLNNGFGSPEDPNTWNNYVAQVQAKAQEKSVVALGITDYFTVEGYKKVFELKKQGRFNNIFIFPNIEFRVDKVIYRSKGGNEPKRLNLHVLLSPDIPIQKIEEGFLHDLDFCNEQDSFNSASKCKLKISNLLEFGEKLKKQHSKFQSLPSLEVGCMNVVVRAEQIKECLDSKFRGQYLLVLADEDLSQMDWNGQDHAVRKHLVQMSHAIFSSNQNTRNFCLGRKHSSPEAFIEEFKSLKPCLWGCDSHSFNERFLEPSNNRYCWIKAEVTWEGLKQVLYEPGERVRIQTEDPEPCKSSFTIESLRVGRTELTDALAVDEFSIELNSNLVTIIGGRGSGKTALLDLIASCFQEGKKLQTIKTSFIYRLYGDKKGKKDSVARPVTISLTFQSGESFKNEIGTETSKSFERADILYLTQDHFEEYSANPGKLNSHIVDLVFNNCPEKRRDYDRQNQQIKQAQQQIQNINLEIEQLHGGITEREESTGIKLKMKMGERDDISRKIISIEEKQVQRDNVINELTESLEVLKQERRAIEKILSSIKQLKLEVEKLDLLYKDHVPVLNQSISALDAVNNLNCFPGEIQELQEVIRLVSKNTLVLNESNKDFESKISAKNQEISELEGNNKVIADLHQARTNLETEIEEAEREIKDINDKKDQIEALDNQRFGLYSDIMQMMSNLRLFLQQVIDVFENGKDEILNNLKFLASVDMSKKLKYIQYLADKLDNRAHSQEEVDRAFSPIFESMESSMNNNDCEGYLSIVQLMKDAVKNFRLKRSTTESDYYNAVFQCFFDLGVEISFNNKSLSNLSMGERAIVLLKILLALDDKPLLMDQPEEHLDNRYIFAELVPVFRSAKKRRQIIIATHNANLVVNTDAEQVIVAEPNERQLRYSSGTIEDPNVRQKIAQILEGGELAFKKREEKYGYRF